MACSGPPPGLPSASRSASRRRSHRLARRSRSSSRRHASSRIQPASSASARSPAPPTLVQTRTPTISHAPIATAPRGGAHNPAATTSRKTDSTAAGRSTASPARRFPTLLPHLEPATTCARRRWRRRAAPTVHPCARCSPPRRPSSPTGSTCHPAPGSGRADHVLHRDPRQPGQKKSSPASVEPKVRPVLTGLTARTPRHPHHTVKEVLHRGSSPRPAIPRPGGRGTGATAASATVNAPGA